MVRTTIKPLTIDTSPDPVACVHSEPSITTPPITPYVLSECIDLKWVSTSDTTPPSEAPDQQVTLHAPSHRHSSVVSSDQFQNTSAKQANANDVQDITDIQDLFSQFNAHRRLHPPQRSPYNPDNRRSPSKRNPYSTPMVRQYRARAAEEWDGIVHAYQDK